MLRATLSFVALLVVSAVAAPLGPAGTAHPEEDRTRAVAQQAWTAPDNGTTVQDEHRFEALPGQEHVLLIEVPAAGPLEVATILEGNAAAMVSWTFEGPGTCDATEPQTRAAVGGGGAMTGTSYACGIVEAGAHRLLFRTGGSVGSATIVIDGARFSDASAAGPDPISTAVRPE